MNTPRIGIIGIGQSAFKPRRDDANYPDLVREAVRLCLQDASLDFDDIEAVVYSLSPDSMVGIGNAERLGIDAVGGRNKRFLRINTGGSTGIGLVGNGPPLCGEPTDAFDMSTRSGRQCSMNDVSLSPA